MSRARGPDSTSVLVSPRQGGNSTDLEARPRAAANEFY